MTGRRGGLILIGSLALSCGSREAADHESIGGEQSVCSDSSLEGRRFDAGQRCVFPAEPLDGLCVEGASGLPSSSFGPVCVVSADGFAFLLQLSKDVNLQSDDSWKLPARDEYPNDWLHYEDGSTEAAICAPLLEFAAGYRDASYPMCVDS